MQVGKGEALRPLLATFHVQVICFPYSMSHVFLERILFASKAFILSASDLLQRYSH